ncbi:hypothetical protein HK096_005452 [Nowakowskiella sp. JEL0078]|nr:hypothetical protein HK096_005452 [Nowakowskiella sp. JEL0078]
MRCILRFAYTSQIGSQITHENLQNPPHNYFKSEPQHNIVIDHVNQLGPILSVNADIIFIVQAGFIGTWGEWHYSDHYGYSPTIDQIDTKITDYNLTLRKQLVDTLLQNLPTSIFVSLRVPWYKQRMYSTSNAISSNSILSNSYLSRLSHHNDAILASSNDMGTYRAGIHDLAYVETESRFTPWGGETCQPNPPQTDATNAEHLLARLHATYLNSCYHPQVLSGWQRDDAMARIASKLGYALVLKRFEVAGNDSSKIQMRCDDDIRMKFSVLNEGFAAPHVAHKMLILFVPLKNSGSEIVSVDVTKFVIPSFRMAFHPSEDAVEISMNIKIPSAPSQTYQIYVCFPPEISQDFNNPPEHNIVFTNRNVKDDPFAEMRWNLINCKIKIL